MKPSPDPYAGLNPDDLKDLAGMADLKNPETIEALLDKCGISGLAQESTMTDIAKALRGLSIETNGTDRLWTTAAREATVKKLQEIGIRSPAALVDAAYFVAKSPDGPETNIAFVEPTPWPDPVNGGELLVELSSIFCKYVVMSSNEALAISLWTILSYLSEAVHILPLLAISSPEKRCGKTLTLEIVQSLALRPLPASNISAASLYRVVEKFRPTLLIDEADTFLAAKDELRGIINAGHRRSFAFVLRCDGDDSEPKPFSTWCPKAIALIGKMVDTLEDRSIAIRMRRKSPDEKIERFQPHKIAAEFETIRRRMARWTQDNATIISNSDPDVPRQLNDRAQDNWRPLLSIADAAGDIWPELARDAAVNISGVSSSGESIRVQLLQDVQAIFTMKAATRIPSDDLCKALHEMEERPWPEWRKGKPITPRQLAALLKPFGIQPKQARFGVVNVRAYDLDDFGDTLSRYVDSDTLQCYSPITTRV
jgi:putative DNA primase/helicase